MTSTTVTDSVCGMCDMYHHTKVHVRDGRATKIEMMNPRVLRVCPRWTAQLDFVYHPDRLKYPLKRIGERGTGSFQRISWDEALNTVASELQQVKTKYGAESVVFHIALPKEPRPYFHRLAHAFGSPNYCTESSACFTATAVAAIATYGRDYSALVGQSIAVDPASKCALVWGVNVKHSHYYVWKDYVEAKQKGLKLIVVDPRRTEIAAMADIHLQLRPGTDGALALGLINVIINEQLYDKEFIDKWTIGFDDLKKLVHEYPPEKVEEITWVPATKVREAAVMYATQKPARVTISPAATVHCSNGVQNHRAIILLPALTGNLDVSGGNRGNPVPFPTNDVTLHELVSGLPPGLGAEKFPIWTSEIREMQANALVDQIENGNPYPIKALVGAGLNTMFFANSERFVNNLKKLDFIVVTDYFQTPGAQLADIILPIASWLERQVLVGGGPGHSPGYLRFVEPAIEPVEESWPEWKIYAELAKRLGFGNEFWDGDFEKYINYMLEPSGITVQDLRQHPEGVKYPLPPRPIRKYEESGFNTPSGKVEITSSILAEHGHESLPVYKEPEESSISRPDLATSFPLVLTSGARVVQYTHSQHRNIPRLRKAVPEPLVEINPADAEPRGIRSGDMVKVSSPRGSARFKADVTDAVLPGVVQAMHHWPGESNVNILVDDQNLDPISGFVAYKSQLCQVELSG